MQTTTENAQEDPSVLTDSAQNQPQHSLLVPTIPPKNPSDTSNLPKGASIESSAQSKQQPNSRFNVNLDVTVRDGTELSDLKSTLLEKYSSSSRILIQNLQWIAKIDATDYQVNS